MRLEGPMKALQSLRPGHSSLGEQGVLSKWWSLRFEGRARRAAVFNTRVHEAGGDRGPAQAVVGAS